MSYIIRSSGLCSVSICIMIIYVTCSSSFLKWHIEDSRVGSSRFCPTPITSLRLDIESKFCYVYYCTYIFFLSHGMVLGIELLEI